MPFSRAAVKLYALRQACGSTVTRAQIAAYDRILTSLGIDPLGTEPLATVTVREILSRYHLYRARELAHYTRKRTRHLSLADLIAAYKRQP